MNTNQSKTEENMQREVNYNPTQDYILSDDILKKLKFDKKILNSIKDKNVLIDLQLCKFTELNCNDLKKLGINKQDIDFEIRKLLPDDQFWENNYSNIDNNDDIKNYSIKKSLKENNNQINLKNQNLTPIFENLDNHNDTKNLRKQNEIIEELPKVCAKNDEIDNKILKDCQIFQKSNFDQTIKYWHQEYGLNYLNQSKTCKIKPIPTTSNNYPLFVKIFKSLVQLNDLNRVERQNWSSTSNSVRANKKQIKEFENEKILFDDLYLNRLYSDLTEQNLDNSVIEQTDRKRKRKDLNESINCIYRNNSNINQNNDRKNDNSNKKSELNNNKIFLLQKFKLNQKSGIKFEYPHIISDIIMKLNENRKKFHLTENKIELFIKFPSSVKIEYDYDNDFLNLSQNNQINDSLILNSNFKSIKLNKSLSINTPDQSKYFNIKPPNSSIQWDKLTLAVQSKLQRMYSSDKEYYLQSPASLLTKKGFEYTLNCLNKSIFQIIKLNGYSSIRPLWEQISETSSQNSIMNRVIDSEDHWQFLFKELRRQPDLSDCDNSPFISVIFSSSFLNSNFFRNIHNEIFLKDKESLNLISNFDGSDLNGINKIKLLDYLTEFIIQNSEPILDEDEIHHIQEENNSELIKLQYANAKEEEIEKRKAINLLNDIEMNSYVIGLDRENNVYQLYPWIFDGFKLTIIKIDQNGKLNFLKDMNKLKEFSESLCENLVTESHLKKNLRLISLLDKNEIEEVLSNPECTILQEEGGEIELSVDLFNESRSEFILNQITEFEEQLFLSSVNKFIDARMYKKTFNIYLWVSSEERKQFYKNQEQSSTENINGMFLEFIHVLSRLKRQLIANNFINMTFLNDDTQIFYLKQNNNEQIQQMLSKYGIGFAATYLVYLKSEWVLILDKIMKELKSRSNFKIVAKEVFDFLDRHAIDSEKLENNIQQLEEFNKNSNQNNYEKTNNEVQNLPEKNKNNNKQLKIGKRVNVKKNINKLNNSGSQSSEDKEDSEVSVYSEEKNDVFKQRNIKYFPKTHIQNNIGKRVGTRKNFNKVVSENESDTSVDSGRIKKIDKRKNNNNKNIVNVKSIVKPVNTIVMKDRDCKECKKHKKGQHFKDALSEICRICEEELD